jgi:hypothetical protein
MMVTAYSHSQQSQGISFFKDKRGQNHFILHASFSFRGRSAIRLLYALLTWVHWTNNLLAVQLSTTGKVLIRRKDGRTFALVTERNAVSPLVVPSIKAKITTQELVDIIREGRER